MLRVTWVSGKWSYLWLFGPTDGSESTPLKVVPRTELHLTMSLALEHTVSYGPPGQSDVHQFLILSVLLQLLERHSSSFAV